MEGARESRERLRDSELWAAVEEMTRLYGGWLAYLLRRQGETTLRVKASDITEALETLSVSAAAEEGCYVITLQEKGGGHEGSH